MSTPTGSSLACGGGGRQAGGGAALLALLQLAGASLPVGAFAYSEGLESLVDSGRVHDAETLTAWLRGAMQHGAVRLETALMRRIFLAAEAHDFAELARRNAWLSATKETEELRTQSHQMGRSLAQLLTRLSPEAQPAIAALGEPVNFACAFGVGAWAWEIDPDSAAMGYLQAWATNAVTVGVKAIPLGQTVGQQILRGLAAEILACSRAIAAWPEAEWGTCGWGLSLASMVHETQYSRLYRS